MKIITSNELVNDFNSQWASKLIVASEDSILDKKDAYERIRNLSTSKAIRMNKKFHNPQEIPNVLHFIECSNDETAIQKYVDDSPFWIRKVQPIKEKIKGFDEKIEKEIPHFVDFIINRPITCNNGNRMYFNPNDLRNDSIKKTEIMSSKDPGPGNVFIAVTKWHQNSEKFNMLELIPASLCCSINVTEFRFSETENLKHWLSQILRYKVDIVVTVGDWSEDSELAALVSIVRTLGIEVIHESNWKKYVESQNAQ